MNLSTLQGHTFSALELKRLIDDGGFVWMATTGRWPASLQSAYSTAIPKPSKGSTRRPLVWKVLVGGEMTPHIPAPKAKT